MTAAFRAWPGRQVAREFVPNGRRHGVVVAALHVGDDTFERVPAPGHAAALGGIGEGDQFVPAAVENDAPQQRQGTRTVVGKAQAHGSPADIGPAEPIIACH